MPHLFINHYIEKVQITNHMKLMYVLLAGCLILTTSCSIREREQALEKRADELDQKEQQLLLIEKQLLLKEEELLARQLLIDSTMQLDSIIPLDNSLVGTWAVKMRCTETNCPGSAIGDVKNETWEISYQDRNLIAKAFDGKKLVRVYSGPFKGSPIQLTTQNEESTSPNTNMVVTIQRRADNVLEGRREIIRTGECKILYELEFKKLR